MKSNQSPLVTAWRKFDRALGREIKANGARFRVRHTCPKLARRAERRKRVTDMRRALYDMEVSRKFAKAKK